MRLKTNLKRVFSYLFITSIIFMIILIGCSLPSNSGSSSGSSNKGGNKKTEEMAMSGSFNIKVDPKIVTKNNLSAKKFSINTKEYTVTALDITVTYVPTSSVVGTFNWTPADGTKTYSVNISQYGEYEIRVVQTAVNDDDPNDIITTEDVEIVNIQPMKVIVVTIVPGASLDIIVDVGSGPSLAVFPEDFDSTSLDQLPNGWKAYQKPQTYVGVVNNISAYSSPNCLRLYDSNDTESANVSASIADSIYGQLSFYFMVPATPETNSYCAIQGSTGEWMIDVCFNDNDRKIEIRKPDGDKIPLTNYEFDSWYKVDMKWDKSTGYLKILINNDDYGNYQMKNPSQKIDRIVFQAGTNNEPGDIATLYVDDVDLTTNVEPIIFQAFTENFDTTPINQIPDDFYSQGGDANTFVGVVDSDIIPHSSPNCLKLSDNSNPNYASILKKMEHQPYGQLTFYLYIAASSPWAGTDIGGVLKLYFNEISGRNITIVQPDQTIVNIGTYTTNTWNKVTIKWDAYTYKYKIFFNDVDLGTFPFINNYIPQIIGLSFTQGINTGGLNYIDDVTFTLNPEFIE